MNICFFGSYNHKYPRNKILLDGLINNGIKISHCHSAYGNFLFRYFDLVLKFISHFTKTDVIYVAFVGQLDMPIAWVLGKIFRKKVVFDMFYSMYDTYVFDRKSTSPNSIKAKSYYWIDRISASLADLVITDTLANTNYYSHNFKVPYKKFRRLFAGGDNIFFKPGITDKPNHKIIVEFHGSFTRLSGAEYFIKAAKILEKFSIKFWFIGDSKIYKYPFELIKKIQPKNLRIYPFLKLHKLANLIQKSDITIGHLGSTQKALRVISNKTFEGLGCKKAVIVINSSANKELLTDKVNALFVKPGDAEDLADKILILVKDSKLRIKIANNGYKLLKLHLTNTLIARQFIKYITELNKSDKKNNLTRIS